MRRNKRPKRKRRLIKQHSRRIWSFSYLAIVQTIQLLDFDPEQKIFCFFGTVIRKKLFEKWQKLTKKMKREKQNKKTRGGVLNGIFWSPWPWPWRSSSCSLPRSLKSSKIALFSARGQHHFLYRRSLVEKRPKPRGKLAKTFFVFRNSRSPENFFYYYY